MLCFDANTLKNTAALYWQAASDHNGRGFGIESSTNGTGWHNIGFVNSQSDNGNRSAIPSYTYTDLQPAPGQNYYWLRQKDNDGSHPYSTVRMLSFKNVYSIAIMPKKPPKV